MISSLLHRIQSDYFLSSRLGEYELLLRTALDQGYDHLTLSNFYHRVLSGTTSEKKIFIHRHDVDTDPATARRFFELEQRFGVRSSYYFRLSTVDIPLMREIHASGSEVGYHFEELASYCKQHKIIFATDVKTHYPEIRQQFTGNFRRLNDQLGFPMMSVASHGDFANRILGVPNYSFLDEEFLRSLGIEFECYDKRLLNSYSVALSDTLAPHFYKPYSPFVALRENHPVIYLLTHPRHWYCSPYWNTRENIKRIVEGFRFKR